MLSSLSIFLCIDHIFGLCRRDALLRESYRIWTLEYIIIIIIIIIIIKFLFKEDGIFNKTC